MQLRHQQRRPTLTASAADRQQVDQAGCPVHRLFVSRHGFTLIEMLAVVAIIGVLISLLLPAVQQARESARRMTCRSNLGQLALAMQSYHASHRMLPSGTVNETGPVQSGIPTDNHFGWIVQILPQLDEGNLWRRFDFHRTSYQQQVTAAETDDIEDDFEGGFQYAPELELTAPGFLQCPTLPASRRDVMCYAGVYHDSAAPIDVDNNGVLFLNSSIRFKDIADGRSYTAMMGEILPSAIAGEWYQGDEETLRYLGDGIDKYEYSPTMQLALARWNADPADVDTEDAAPAKTPLRFGSMHADGANVALSDGAVRFLSSKTDGTTLRRLGNRRDGKVVGSF